MDSLFILPLGNARRTLTPSCSTRRPATLTLTTILPLPSFLPSLHILALSPDLVCYVGHRADRHGVAPASVHLYVCILCVRVIVCMCVHLYMCVHFACVCVCVCVCMYVCCVCVCVLPVIALTGMVWHLHVCICMCVLCVYVCVVRVCECASVCVHVISVCTIACTHVQAPRRENLQLHNRGERGAVLPGSPATWICTLLP